MTSKGYTQGYIVQYVVADLDGTVIDAFDDRETAEACAEDGQQIVELDGYGYVREITDASDECGDDPSPYIFQPYVGGQAENAPQQAVNNGCGAATGYNPGLYPRFPWTRG